MKGPFRYEVHAVTYLKAARRHAHRPLKQAVISACAEPDLSAKRRGRIFARDVPEGSY